MRVFLQRLFGVLGQLTFSVSFTSITGILLLLCLVSFTANRILD